LQNLCRQQKKKEECNNHTFQDFLITVIQRLPQYIMLLTSLLKYTPIEHKDHKVVLQSLRKVKAITTSINEGKKQKQNHVKLLQIHSDLGIKEDIPSSREFIFEDTVYKQVPPKKKAELANFNPKFQLYLFTDTIILAKYNQNALQSIKYYSPPSTSFISTVSGDVDTALKLSSLLQSSVLYCRSKLSHQNLCASIKLCL